MCISVENCELVTSKMGLVLNADRCTHVEQKTITGASDECIVCRTAEYYYQQQNDIGALFSIVDGINPRLYLRAFPERILLPSLERRNIRHIFATDKLIVWTEEHFHLPER